MYQTTLEGLGLSPNEAKIYETLVEHGELGVSAIATRAQIHRRNAYDAIRRLVDKGLCFEILSQKENLYNAVDPGKLLELAEEKRLSIEAILPDLNKKFAHRVADEEAFIYRGLEGQKNIWRDVLRVGQETYFIGGKGSWIDPRLQSSRVAFFKEANRKKIKFHQLFDQGVKQHKLIYDVLTSYPAQLYENRILPKKFSSQASLHIFGDYVISYTGIDFGITGDNASFFVIKSPALAESYRVWFWALFDQSSEEARKGIPTSRQR
ncbi:MAG: hypothetical protein COU11_04495 [Candidatus Harrisonbacteria bacterium CG10_big_fil_rev_8_21_14_0_10_49_15]|uniref:Transcription regulator TrmB N-terminal domain-containing protein n=1 Tax=Candidatus Harrisonbacteria bacterium CG10_big_fil_rev_8_21_14_0_10_49_15 TaxID=1974587 RepID=A0A2H0UK12_9BACT|nr:MAG: hypothetical protein COU11_04495 [Candidatus Harrisonbacteria bacterium CG10_big_fil_rev_8_21_14_0_10_49_15]